MPGSAALADPVAAYSGTDNGERTALISGSTTTVFRNGPEGLAGSTIDGADTGFTREARGTLNSVRSGGSSYYYLTGAHGSVLGLVDAAGHRTATYTYDSLGGARTTAQSVPQPYRFQGTYLDPTGGYTMGARYYDPILGRCTQTDPSGKETNSYPAFGADPVNRTDPGGTLSFGDISDVLDWGGLASDVLSGDEAAAFADKVGMLTGIGLEALCDAGAVAAGRETLGFSVGAGITGCTVVSYELAEGAKKGTQTALS